MNKNKNQENIKKNREAKIFNKIAASAQDIKYDDIKSALESSIMIIIFNAIIKVQFPVILLNNLIL